jgi:hypothetical protein
MEKDFREILVAFNDAGVDYLVVGAYAMAAHGLPRATGDIDLWVRCTADNADRVAGALAAFGAPPAVREARDFATPNIVVQIGVQPNRVDIMTAVSGVEFEEAVQARVVHVEDGVRAPYIGRADLIRNKRASGRKKDLLDAEWLESHPE